MTEHPPFVYTGFLGIDPGVSGAVAIVTPEGQPLDSIRCSETWHDVSNWLKKRSEHYELNCIIETVGPMPKQGLGSTFKFGKAAGIIEGIVIALGIRHSFATASKWQQAMQCRSGGDKKITKARAQQLFPQVKMTHAIADAYLIAEYCRTHRSWN